MSVSHVGANQSEPGCSGDHAGEDGISCPPERAVDDEFGAFVGADADAPRGAHGGLGNEGDCGSDDKEQDTTDGGCGVVEAFEEGRRRGRCEGGAHGADDECYGEQSAAESGDVIVTLPAESPVACSPAMQHHAADERNGDERDLQQQP